MVMVMNTVSAPTGIPSTFSSRTPGQLKAKPYLWPHDASLHPQTTALVVIDMQRDCTTTEAHIHVKRHILTRLEKKSVKKAAISPIKATISV